MDDCLFCKIVKGEIPCSKIYEDDKMIAFLDIRPTNKGHTLIVPKEHHLDLTEMPDDLLSAVAVLSKKIAKAVLTAVNADGVNIIQNNKGAAGQLVMHYHLHVVPRFSNDGFKHWPGKELPEEEMKEIQEKIKSSI